MEPQHWKDTIPPFHRWCHGFPRCTVWGGKERGISQAEIEDLPRSETPLCSDPFSSCTWNFGKVPESWASDSVFQLSEGSFFARCLASANWACLAGHLVNGRRVQESTDVLVGHLFTTNLRGWYPSNLTSILAQMGQQAFLEICFLLMKVQLSVWMLGELSDLVPGSPGELTCMVRRGHGRWISYKSVPLLCTEKNCLLDGTQEFNATDMRVLEDWRDDPHPPDCYRFWQATKSERSPFPVLWCFLIEGTLHHLR